MISTATISNTPVKEKELALKQDQLFPGQQVSMDHFKVSHCGRLYTSMGKTQPELCMLVGAFLLTMQQVMYALNLSSILTPKKPFVPNNFMKNGCLIWELLFKPTSQTIESLLPGVLLLRLKRGSKT